MHVKDAEIMETDFRSHWLAQFYWLVYFSVISCLHHREVKTHEVIIGKDYITDPPSVCYHHVSLMEFVKK